MLRVVLYCLFVFCAEAAEVRWLHLSTATNHLPLPSTAKVQTGSVTGDFDNDKTNDFVLAFADAGPALVLYHRATNWTTLPIEIEPLPIAPNGVATDIEHVGMIERQVGHACCVVGDAGDCNRSHT